MRSYNEILEMYDRAVALSEDDSRYVDTATTLAWVLGLSNSPPVEEE